MMRTFLLLALLLAFSSIASAQKQVDALFGPVLVNRTVEVDRPLYIVTNFVNSRDAVDNLHSLVFKAVLQGSTDTISQTYEFVNAQNPNGMPRNAGFREYSIVVQTPVVPKETGSTKLILWIDQVKAVSGDSGVVVTDMNTSNNRAEIDLFVFSGGAAKKTLSEFVTGAWCQFCPQATTLSHQMYENYDNSLIVKVHNNDVMSFPAGDQLQAMYPSAGVPSVMVDRFRPAGSSVYSATQSAGYIEIFHLVRTDKFIRNSLRPMNSPVRIEAIQNDYNASSRSFTGKFKVTFMSDLEGPLRFNAYIVEDNLSGRGRDWAQVNAFNNDPESEFYRAGNPIQGFNHRHVARELVHGARGKNLATSYKEGDTFEETIEFNLPEEYNPNDVEVIGFVYAEDTRNAISEIFNAEHIDVGNLVSRASNNRTAGIGQFVVFPNPSEGAVSQLAYQLTRPSANVRVEVADITGKILLQESIAGQHAAGDYIYQLDNSRLDVGVYSVQLITDEGQVSTKLMIAR